MLDLGLVRGLLPRAPAARSGAHPFPRGALRALRTRPLRALYPAWRRSRGRRTRPARFPHRRPLQASHPVPRLPRTPQQAPTSTSVLVRPSPSPFAHCPSRRHSGSERVLPLSLLRVSRGHARSSFRTPPPATFSIGRSLPPATVPRLARPRLHPELRSPRPPHSPRRRFDLRSGALHPHHRYPTRHRRNLDQPASPFGPNATDANGSDRTPSASRARSPASNRMLSRVELPFRLRFRCDR